jgi:hypothetical protein
MLAPPSAPGLFGQVKTSLQIAHDLDPDYILYTEPNKPHFFAEQLAAFVGHATERAAGVEEFGLVLPARNPESLATFPPFQQKTESLMSEMIRFVIGGETAADYLYGPRMLAPALIQVLDRIDYEIGWGWMSFLVVAAHARGKSIETLAMDLPCPPEERVDDQRERLLRLRQMRDHVNGIHEALRLSP